MDFFNVNEKDKSHVGFKEAPCFSINVGEGVGSASISPSGRDIVLASRQGLHVIDLDSPYDIPRHLPHHTPWVVADVQWSPFASRDYWVVSTSNQKALVWNLNMSSMNAPIEFVLQAHSRAITDINFSAHNPDLLATCAVDSFVHCWDLRQPTRPAFSFCDWFAGATQVKWSRQDSHIIASSHDRFLRIWDDRKGAYPLKSIDAHATKIYGIDWNRTKATSIVTCSLDKTIKFWDFSQSDDEPQSIIHTPFPVWRARHTPFGWGLLAMPQRGSHDLHLYDRRHMKDGDGNGMMKSVHSFDGHTDQVKEFLWRQRGNFKEGMDYREFQLVSWGADMSVRLHNVSESCLRAVGYEKGMPISENLQFTRQGAIYKSFREQSSSDGNRSVDSTATDSSGLQRVTYQKPQETSALLSEDSHRDAGLMTFPGIRVRDYRKKAMNPINWMKRIKLPKRQGHRLSDTKDTNNMNLPPDEEKDVMWEIPENLGDELTQVGEKFSELVFEQIDILKRTATASLNRPWDADVGRIHLRVKMDFPSDYPKKAEANFKIERVSTIPEKLLFKLSTEMQEISKLYRLHGQGCLTAVFRYLLGDRNLEETKTWIGTYDAPLESSSDEEDGIGADFNGSQSQNLEISGVDISNKWSANANVPLPKACGATWAHEGRLICFFPPKEEKKLLLNDINIEGNERPSKSSKAFEGFGRLNTDSPEPRCKTRSSIITADDNSDSEYSYATGSSSDSSEGIDEIPSRFQPPAAWRVSHFKMQRTRSTERSQQSGSLGVISSTLSTKSKSIVSIHHFNELLPSKKCLAEEYAIFGDGPSVCSHNANVSSKHGYHDLADIWTFTKLILENDVPLKIMERPQKKDKILVLVRRGLVSVSRRQSQADLTVDNGENAQRPQLKGRVKWGDHPFARAWLIGELFTHFESLGDIQMLAMLSCIFWEPDEKEAISTALARPTENEMPLSMKSPAFSLGYFPSFESACSIQLNTTLRPTMSGLHQPYTEKYGSLGSSSEAWNSKGHDSHSHHVSPGVLQATSSRAGLQSATQSTTSSLEQKRRDRRSAANLHVPFSMSASTSPPDPSQIARIDGELSTSAPSGGITWGMNTVFNAAVNMNTSRASTRTRDNAGSNAHTLPDQFGNSQYLDCSDSDSEYAESLVFAQTSKVTANGKYGLAAKLKNQDSFDEEATVSAPLLFPRYEARYQAYRLAYAHLLFNWGLTMQRCELLSFNGLPSYWHKSNSQDNNAYSKYFDKHVVNDEDENSPPDSGDFLQVCIVCPQCGHGTSNHKGIARTSDVRQRSKCMKCQRYATRLQCTVCWEPIRGLYKICVSCGHATHASCAVANSCFADESEFSMLCETGCGCNCAAHDLSSQDLQTLVRDEDVKRSGATNRRRESHNKREQERKQKNVSRKAPSAGASRGLRQSFVMAVKGGR